MMNRQRLNPLRQQQQQQHHCNQHTDRGHEIGQSPRQPLSPQALTVRRKAPSTRPDQMTTGSAAAPIQKRCVSRGRGRGTAMTGAPIAGDWGTRMAKTSENNIGRRGAVPPSRFHQPLLPRVARLATKQTKTTPGTHIVAASLPQPVAPIVPPPPNVMPVEALSKSPYMPSGSDNPSRSLPDQTTSSSSNSGRHRHKIKLANAIRLPDQQNKSFVYLCKPVKKVKELLTARRLRQSIEHMDHHSDEDDCTLIEKLNNSARTLTESNCKNNYSDQSSSTTTSSPFESLEILQQRYNEVEHFTVLPNKNYQQKVEIQLKDVRKQKEEFLQYLAKESNVVVNDGIGIGKDDIQMVNRHHKNDVEKLVCQNIPTLQYEIKHLQELGEKLEATLRSSVGPSDKKNIYTDGSIRREHIELSSLSDDNYINRKNKTNIDYNNFTASQSSSIYYTPRSILPDELVIYKIGCLRIEQVPLISERASILAAVHYFSFIREFRIEMKTLNEIKTGDDTQCFYMPVPPTNLNRNKSKAKTKTKTDTNDDIEIDTKAETEATELRSTSFRKLRENPNVLLHQLRPTTSMRLFNLLEQDTMFINSLVYGNDAKLSSCTSLGNEYRESGGGSAATGITQSAHDRLSVTSQTFSWSQLQQSVQAATTQTDVRNQKLKPSSSYSSLGSRKGVLKRKSTPRLSNEHAKILKEILTTSTQIPAVSMQHQAPGHRRRNKPRQVGPCGNDVEPKIHMQLAKTVAVGLIQIAVFLVLIMAFTYPDIRC